MRYQTFLSFFLIFLSLSLSLHFFLLNFFFPSSTWSKLHLWLSGTADFGKTILHKFFSLSLSLYSLSLLSVSLNLVFFLLLPTSISCTDFFPFSFLRIYHASSFCVSECVSVCVCVLVCSSWTDYNLFYHSSSSISSSCFSISFQSSSTVGFPHEPFHLQRLLFLFSYLHLATPRYPDDKMVN